MSAPVTDEAAEPAPAQPARGVAVPAAVGVIVAVVVAVLVIVGLAVSLTDDRLPTGPALPPPAATGPEVTYDNRSGAARYAEAAITMPRYPYVCPSRAESALPLLSAAVNCSVTIHENFDGDTDWTATAGFGSVPEDLVRPTPEGTAKALFQVFREEGFGSRPTTLKNYTSELTTLGGRQVAAVSGNVHYDIPGLASNYDRVLFVALQLEDGGYAAFFSSRPDDTPKSTLDVLNASLAGLRYR